MDAGGSEVKGYPWLHKILRPDLMNQWMENKDRITEDMAQWLREQSALAEDPSLVSSIL